MKNRDEGLPDTRRREPRLELYHRENLDGPTSQKDADDTPSFLRSKEAPML